MQTYSDKQQLLGDFSAEEVEKMEEGFNQYCERLPGPYVINATNGKEMVTHEFNTFIVGVKFGMEWDTWNEEEG